MISISGNLYKFEVVFPTTCIGMKLTGSWDLTLPNPRLGIILRTYLRRLSVEADLDIVKFIVIFLQVSSQRHLPVLRQVLDGPQQLGKTLVVIAATSAEDGGRARR